MVTKMIDEFDAQKIKVYDVEKVLSGQQTAINQLRQERKEERAQYGAILARLREIDVGLAGVQGYTRGKANGK